MQADWLWGLAGGLVIGSGAALYLLANGRIMGASGIIGELVDGTDRASAMERLSFLLALAAVPALLVRAAGWPSEMHLSTSLPLLAAAGFLVGLGTRLANGCTSGHGVCGISRLAPRGIVATLIYLLTGAVTLYVARHLLGAV